MDLSQLSEKDIQQLNDLEGFLSFKKTWIYGKFLNSAAKINALFTGNQFGKTAGVAHSYVARILGVHPIPVKNVVYWECEKRAEFKQMVEGQKRKQLKLAYDSEHFHKNVETGKRDFGTFGVTELPKDGKCSVCGSQIVQHKRKSRVFRFCSQTLPSGGKKDRKDKIEIANTQYPALMMWLPKSLVKEDTTFRDHYLVLSDPFGGEDIVIEFVGYTQPIQRTAGTQRMSVWYDEEPSYDFRKEQVPRLLAEDGDEVVTLTPANYISWMYDEIYEKGSVYYRTRKICEFLKKQDGKLTKQVERIDSGSDIAVFQAATDDNPTLSNEAIEALFENLSDPDDVAIRRFGLFKQVSGRIFKDFSLKTHVLSENFVKKNFPDGIPQWWTHARGIDYHPHTPWAFGVMSLSPRNEAFVWQSLELPPDKLTNEWMAREMMDVCEDYEFTLSLIDPLAEAHRKDTPSGEITTMRKDLNNICLQLKRDGFGNGAFWQTWDTKGEKGRDEIKKRLANSLKCKVPFNNKILKSDGTEEFLPTLWIFFSCRVASHSMRNWRWEQFTDAKMLQLKESKNTFEQKNSHMNMVWEAIFKNPRFKVPVLKKPNQRKSRSYMKRRKRS